MQVHYSRTAEELAGQLHALWSAPSADPFAFDLAVVPGAGFQRWLSQRLATTDERAGICAGIEFVSLRGLERRLEPRDDPWLPDRLTWSVQKAALESSEPELEVLHRHFTASRQTFSAAQRIAYHLAGYARHRPQMLTAWATGADIGPDQKPLPDNAWQPHLYRKLIGELGSDPVQSRRRLLDRVSAGETGGLPSRIAVLAPGRLDHAMLELLDRLGAHHQVDLLLLTPSPGRCPAPPASDGHRVVFASAGHPLNAALSTVADETAQLVASHSMTPPGSPRQGTTGPDRASQGPAPYSGAAGDHLLGWLQSDLAGDVQHPTRRVLSPADFSVQVHLSHGRDRQVEVLREVLAGLLSADESLEPRDIVVLTPQVDAFAPLLSAAFTAPAGTANHPAQHFRVRVADRSLAQANSAAALLIELLRLPDSRMEASTVLELCAHPAIARRFGFKPEDRERLADLVERTGVRWGLSDSQREAFGLAGFRQNTWLAGLQRMLLGVALPETGAPTNGTVLPLDDVVSSDLDLIGGLTELVGRLSRLIGEFSKPASLSEWTQRCREGLAQLVTMPNGEDWQLDEVWAALRRLTERGAAGATPLTRHSAASAIAQEFTGTPMRGAFGNGSLVVGGLRSLSRVPHRVVVLLGWDSACYPRPMHAHGDDLLGLRPRQGDPSAALADRQALLDAVHAAKDQLVIIAQGRSEATNEHLPPAAPIAELLAALDLTATAPDGTPAGAAVTVQHPLQPFDPRYFDGSDPRLRSTDPFAHRAALALVAEPSSPGERYALDTLPEPDLSGGVSLDDLVGFFNHPARALLRTRAGIRFSEEFVVEDAIPIEPDGLARWQIGNRVLRQLRDGRDPETVARAEWLRGDVPPFELGRSLLDGVLAEATRTVRQIPADLAERQLHDLALTITVPGRGSVPFVGRVATYGSELLQVEFSALQPRHRLAAWLRLLALAATTEGSWRVRVVGKGRVAAYQAPPRTVAEDLLGRYLGLYALGLSRPLPALPRLCHAWAECRSDRRDPEDRVITDKSFARCWEFDSDPSWKVFFSYPQLRSLGLDGLDVPGADPAEQTLLGALASSIWAPIMAGEVPA